MAKKRRKSGGKKRAAPRKSSHRRKSNPRRSSRRRRNPAGGFGDRLIKLGLGAGVALLTATGVIYAQGKFAQPAPGQTTNNLMLYGIPAATALVGVAAAKAMPTLGVGMALGAFSPFALPLASKALSSGTPSANAAAGISRAFRSMRAVGAIDYHPSMGAVDMHGWNARNYAAYGS